MSSTVGSVGMTVGIRSINGTRTVTLTLNVLNPGTWASLPSTVTVQSKQLRHRHEWHRILEAKMFLVRISPLGATHRLGPCFSTTVVRGSVRTSGSR
jgi:hypothetical protein